MNESNDLGSPGISRRAVLGLLPLAAAGGLLAGSRFSPSTPTIAERENLDLPFSLSRPRSVVVVGGGLAGLASAYELTRRGFAVTLLERAPQLGGKIASWPVEALGRSFTVEHGFHGFFPQYYNLRAVMAELGASGNFRSLDSYAVLYRRGYKPEVFRPSHSAFPWNVVDLTVASPNRFRWGLNLTRPAHWRVFREIAGFDPAGSFRRLDHLSVSDWARNDFPRGLFDLYFLPFARSSLNAPDVLSAGELMQFFHFYFFGNPEGLAFEGTRHDMGTSVVAPLQRAIESGGGRILLEARVTAVDWGEEGIEGIRCRRGDRRPAPFWVAPANGETAAGSGETTGTLLPVAATAAADGERFVLDPQGRRALSLTCPHQGCTVRSDDEGGFVCPCHGARFDAAGRVTAGPARRDLQSYTIQGRDGERLRLAPARAEEGRSDPAEPEELLTADHYVFATDVPGVKQLFRLAQGSPPPALRSRIEALAIADPFAVVRYWFDRDFPWPHSAFTSLSGFRLTDSITLYHRLQEEAIAWAAESGGSVVELHAYCYKERDFPDQDSLLRTFEAELHEIVPELRQARLLHREIVNQKNFSGYPPGSHELRPATCCEAANLCLAGDWVKMPFPCGLMERAVSSGLLAANEILRREGLERRTLYSVTPKGVLSALQGPSPDPAPHVV